MGISKELHTRILKHLPKASKAQGREYAIELNVKQAQEVLTEIKKTLVLACPECGPHNNQGEGYIKYGRYKDKQRFKCKACDVTFCEHVNSPSYHLHKGKRTWERFVYASLRGVSLEEASKALKIQIATAHRWRLKLLKALQKLVLGATLKGVVWGDETFLRTGSPGRKSSSGPELRCLLTLYDGSRAKCKYVSTGNASMRNTDAKSFIKKHLSGEVLLTDRRKGYGSLAANVGIKHQGVLSGHSALNGNNYFHKRLKKWVKQFNGIATRYLNEYLSWFSWLTGNPQLQKEII